MFKIYWLTYYDKFYIPKKLILKHTLYNGTKVVNRLKKLRESLKCEQLMNSKYKKGGYFIKIELFPKCRKYLFLNQINPQSENNPLTIANQ